MRVIKCDKCGKEITEDRERVYGVYKDNGSSEAELLDLCDKHYFELANWVINKGSLVTADDTMTVRQILEKFEEWLMNGHLHKSVVIDNFKFTYNGVSAIDEYLKEEGIEE